MNKVDFEAARAVVSKMEELQSVLDLITEPGFDKAERITAYFSGNPAIGSEETREKLAVTAAAAMARALAVSLDSLERQLSEI